jgi:pimeloyl-ACP methyl ester carboxylesterase
MSPRPRRHPTRENARVLSALGLAVLVGLVGLAGVIGAACGADGDGDGLDGLEVTTVERPDTTRAFRWADFGEDGVQTGWLEVPVDPDDSSLGTFDLYIARHLADPDRRVGTLLVNPGGPGVAGSDFAIFADQWFSPTLLEHFDIVGWDPRGTGLSEPAIDCVDDYDRYFAAVDITPDDDAERAAAIELSEQFLQGCIDRSGTFLEHVGTNDSAADIDRIRAALDEETISYFGFSYGSELGAAWATLFPDTVRAAVFDGAVDPTLSQRDAGLQQAAGFEAALTTFFAWCDDEDNECAFGGTGSALGGSAAEFDRLMADVDASPVPTEDGRPPVDLGVMNNGVGQALYTSQLWPDLGQALANADAGDGNGLLALHDLYFGRRDDGTWDNTIEAFQVIRCMDDPERESQEEAQARLDEARAIAPRVVPATVATPSCGTFPAPDQGRIEITGVGTAPIVVVGTTGDSATPIDGTRSMADTLDNAVLVVVEAEQHTGYGANDCIIDAVDRYLVALEAPSEGLTCS